MKRRTHLLVSAAALLLLTFGWPSSAGAQQYQFGYLSYRQALQAMPEYTAAQQSLSALKTKYDDEAKYNEEKFRKMFADFLEGQKGFPQEIMLKRQKELQVAMEQGISFRKDAERCGSSIGKIHGLRKGISAEVEAAVVRGVGADGDEAVDSLRML